MVSGTRDNPTLRQLYQAFICEKVVPVGRVKVFPGVILLSLLKNQMYKYPSFFEFPSVSRS